MFPQQFATGTIASSRNDLLYYPFNRPQSLCSPQVSYNTQIQSSVFLSLFFIIQLTMSSIHFHSFSHAHIHHCNHVPLPSLLVCDSLLLFPTRLYRSLVFSWNQSSFRIHLSTTTQRHALQCSLRQSLVIIYSISDE